MSADYRVFTWGFSYFSAKVRAYCRYKAFKGAFSFEEVLATQEIIQGYIIPATGSNVVPQVQSRSGEWLQDTSEIIDALEARHSHAPVVPTTPKQRLVTYLVELLADEWMLPWGFWERWHYSLASTEPNHEAFNAQQWGQVFAPDQSGTSRREAGRFIFKEIMGIDDPKSATFGPYAGLIQLGVTDKTEAAWTDSMHRMLGILETHFDQYDYVLGYKPSLADFALMGPLYPHVFRDPVSGFMLRTEYPLVCEWIERANGTTESGVRSYRETGYKLEESTLVPFEHEGNWLPNDEIPDTLLPLIGVFFEEMWPVMKSSIHVLKKYINENPEVTALPFKSFYSPADFTELQSRGGALSHEFTLGGVTEERMVSAYQVWMLGRISDAVASDLAEQKLSEFLSSFDSGPDFETLPELIQGCRIKKQFEQLYAIKS